MTGPSSYLLCGTPRTGSTLLCDLLTSTGAAGRPASYFREPDERAWARRLGVEDDGLLDPRRFVEAVAVAGRTRNGVFGARVMWGSLDRLVHGLAPEAGGGSDLQVLTEAFGPLVLVHLRRLDVVGQAVSWARAEQTGHWQDGDRSTAEPRFDLALVDELVRRIREHDAAWRTWFDRQGVEPHAVTYEDVVADPRTAVEELLARLGVALPPGWRPGSAHRKQADEVNADWVRRYRAARPGDAQRSTMRCTASG